MNSLRFTFDRLLTWLVDSYIYLVTKLEFGIMSKNLKVDSIVGSMNQEDMLMLNTTIEMSKRIRRIAEINDVSADILSSYKASIEILGTRLLKYPALTEDLNKIFEQISNDNLVKIPGKMLSVVVKHGLFNIHYTSPATA